VERGQGNRPARCQGGSLGGFGHDAGEHVGGGFRSSDDVRVHAESDSEDVSAVVAAPSWAGLAPVARSILVIVWHLLADPSARFTDLGPDWHERKTDCDRKIRAHLCQRQALGLEVTVTPVAALHQTPLTRHVPVSATGS